MTRDRYDDATARAWSELGGAPELLDGVSYDGASDGLPSRLPVRELARATVGVCSLAAAELLAKRNGGPLPPVRVDEGAVATAFVSERHLLIDGVAHPGFAPLSGFWQTADGWVRTHANYPHHRARLLAALGLPEGTTPEGTTPEGTTPDGTTPEALTEELRRHPAGWVQETAYAAGGLAVAVTQARRESREPLLRQETHGTARALPPAELPAAGVRVLDLTRTIAGPVATRTLGLLGADVLRIDSLRLPEADSAHADTGFGKRSALLDLADPKDRAVFETELLPHADVLVTGYRPGALAAYGLSPDALRERHPGLVLAELSAWGWTGPWAGRRGFDSLVQAGCGIAAIEAGPDGRPGALPAQALDHATGYLIAAGVLRALTEGVGRHLRFSLAGTAHWLLDGIRDASRAESGYDPAPYLTETASGYGLLRHARPPIGYAGAPTAWSRPPGRWGTDPAVWL